MHGFAQRRKEPRSRKRSCSLDLNQIIEERSAGAEVGQFLRDQLIDVRVSRTQLVPPYKKSHCHAGFDPIAYPGLQPAFASIVPHPHNVTITDSPTQGVFTADLNKRLALAIEKRIRRWADQLQRITGRQLRSAVGRLARRSERRQRIEPSAFKRFGVELTLARGRQKLAIGKRRVSLH